jgi:hypothetical protein
MLPTHYFGMIVFDAYIRKIFVTFGSGIFQYFVDFGYMLSVS